MKLCIATGIYPPDIGGPATFCKIAAEELTARGHYVVVVTYGESAKRKAKSEKPQFKIQNISRKIPKGARHILYFYRVLKSSYGADAILALDTVSAGLPALFAARALRKKFFVRIVGDYAWEQGMQRFGVSDLLDDFPGKKYGWRVELLRKIQRTVTDGAQKVIVPSLYLKEIVKRWGIAEEKIALVPNSVELMPVLSKKDARKKLGFSETETILISAGRMVPWKGFSELIRVLGELPKELNPKLILVGDGPERAALEALSRSLGLQDSVIFAGAVSHEEVLTYISAADIFLLNTAYEGFSHQLIATMAVGLPLITTPVGGNAEIARDEVNALVVTYNAREAWKDAILRMVNDAALRTRLAEQAKKTASIFTVENTISQLIATLENK